MSKIGIVVVIAAIAVLATPALARRGGHSQRHAEPHGIERIAEHHGGGHAAQHNARNNAHHADGTPHQGPHHGQPLAPVQPRAEVPPGPAEQK